MKTEFSESFGQLSPDGRWMAYLSDESGDFEVYVRAFPSGGGKTRISTSTGRHVGRTTSQPRWSADGKTLFYLTGPVGKQTLVAVSVHSAASTFTVGAAELLFAVRANNYSPASSSYFYSVSNDGQRFLIDVVDSEMEPVLNVVVNWVRALGARQ